MPCWLRNGRTGTLTVGSLLRRTETTMLGRTATVPGTLAAGGSGTVQPVSSTVTRTPTGRPEIRPSMCKQGSHAAEAHFIMDGTYHAFQIDLLAR